MITFGDYMGKLMILSEIDTLESGGIIINPKVSCIAR